jgi:prophage DNA circulation protein
MSFFDRLREASFIAPTGDEILFQVNTLERSGGKKGATQEILDSGQSISQDQGNQVTVYNVNAYFTGENYDLFTDLFWDALSLRYTQENPGVLLHPRWGDINVFPFTWSQREELIDGIGVGRINVTFRRVFPLAYPTTEKQSLDDALANIDALEEITLELSGNMFLDALEDIDNFLDTMSEAVGFISESMTAIADGIQAVTDLIENIQSGINGLIEDFSGNAFQIIAATQRLIRAPGRLIDQTTSTIDGYNNMITGLLDSFNDPSETATTNRVNNAIMMELVGGYAVAAMAEASGSAELTNRAQSIKVIESVEESADLFTTKFEEARQPGTAPGGGPADPPILIQNEYSGDHNFFSLAQDTVRRINAILLNQAFDLKAEKKFILKTNSDIMTLCYDIYKAVDNETMKFFIESNRFVGDEYEEIPAGREIVSYA